MDRNSGILIGVGAAGVIGAALLFKPKGTLTPVEIVVTSSGIPISGATVTLAGQTLLTNSSGEADYPTVPTGNQSISVSATGYNTLTETLSISADSTYQVNLIPTSGGGGGTLIISEALGEITTQPSGEQEILIQIDASGGTTPYTGTLIWSDSVTQGPQNSLAFIRSFAGTATVTTGVVTVTSADNQTKQLRVSAPFP